MVLVAQRKSVGLWNRRPRFRNSSNTQGDTSLIKTSHGGVEPTVTAAEVNGYT